MEKTKLNTPEGPPDIEAYNLKPRKSGKKGKVYHHR